MLIQIRKFKVNLLCNLCPLYFPLAYLENIKELLDIVRLNVLVL